MVVHSKGWGQTSEIHYENSSLCFLGSKVVSFKSFSINYYSWIRRYHYLWKRRHGKCYSKQAFVQQVVWIAFLIYMTLVTSKLHFKTIRYCFDARFWFYKRRVNWEWIYVFFNIFRNYSRDTFRIKMHPVWTHTFVWSINKIFKYLILGMVGQIRGILFFRLSAERFSVRKKLASI